MAKIQRKVLTTTQKKEICRKHIAKVGDCDDCPLYSDAINNCWKGVKIISKMIKNYWNEEVEVEL